MDYIEDRDNNAVLQVTDVFPDPTKPTCYVALTQQNLFKAIMGGVIDLPIQDQISLLNEYYDCPTLQAHLASGTGKLNQSAYNEYCNIDPTAWD